MTDRLLELLKELGCVASTQPSGRTDRGFPVRLGLPDGTSITLDLPEPSYFDGMNPNQLGLALIDSAGHCLRRWGLAEKVDLFDPGASLNESPLHPALESAREGIGTTWLEGNFRFWFCEVPRDAHSDILVLVTNAQEEVAAQKMALRSSRYAQALKRLGKALTMNQTLDPLCSIAVGEIVSAVDLAAALLWVRTADDRTLDLMAHAGVSRQGVALLQTLNPMGGTSCIAEFVAGALKPFTAKSVEENLMTSPLEGKICYLKPGPIYVVPLVVADKLIGVLELLGKESDRVFLESTDLFETIAEHLALALNSAMMFESVERLALYDPLTGIANHRTMQDFLTRRVAESQRTGSELSVVMIDVDHFRSFNEEEGHDAGDEVLKLVANVLRESLRPYDLAARYGGEEFTLIMPGVGRAGAIAAAERVRIRIAGLEYMTRSGRVRHITASFGCATFPHNAEEPANLLKAADEALFEAKRNGRNRVETFLGLFGDFGENEDAGADTTAGRGHTPLIDLNPLESILSKTERLEAATYRESLEHLVLTLGREMNLSRNQEQLLLALVQIAPIYLRWKRENRSTKLKKLFASHEARTLTPSLLSLEERFDGTGALGQKGNQIPLLGRILAVLTAIQVEAPGILHADPGRFDPEIISLLSRIDLAA